jgi:hypothetical protein
MRKAPSGARACHVIKAVKRSEQSISASGSCTTSKARSRFESRKKDVEVQKRWCSIWKHRMRLRCRANDVLAAAWIAYYFQSGAAEVKGSVFPAADVGRREESVGVQL